MVKKIQKFRSFDELLNSELASEEKILELVKLGNISTHIKETKKTLVQKLLYESIYGLDEILNILFTEETLKEISSILGIETRGKNKNNMIGLIVKKIPPKRERKIETVIDEAAEDSERLIIYNLFVMYRNGTCLFSYNLERLDIGNSSLITSALNAINGLLQEITKTNSKLDSIDIKEKDLIFEYIGDIVGVLLLNKESEMAKALLKKFLNEFFERYKEHILQYYGDISVFESAGDLVLENFSSYFKK